MDELVVLEHLEDLENQENKHAVRLLNRGKDPFQELSDTQFIKMFRVSKEVCQYLINELEPNMRSQRRNTDLSIAKRILIALRFFATGSYQMDIGVNSYLGASQPSVSRSVQEVINVMNRPEIFNQWVKFPNNFEELNSVRLKFSQRYNFPGVIGCIDCTHIAIFPPNTHHPGYPEHIYVNRKGFHSINVQLIADSDLRIINVNAKYPGSTHDAYIWQNSNIYNVLQQLHNTGHTDYFLLGDSGYPLRTWLLTPLEEEPAPNTAEYRYNTAHKRTRSVIKRVNGILKMRFRCCTKYRTLHYAPEVACKIINTCVMLHNMCIEHNIPVPEEEFQDEDMFNMEHYVDLVQNDAVRRINPELAAGRNARRGIIHTYFR